MTSVFYRLTSAPPSLAFLFSVLYKCMCIFIPSLDFIVIYIFFPLRRQKVNIFTVKRFEDDESSESNRNGKRTEKYIQLQIKKKKSNEQKKNVNKIKQRLCCCFGCYSFVYYNFSWLENCCQLMNFFLAVSLCAYYWFM